jgi:hypothetical protein
LDIDFTNKYLGIEKVKWYISGMKFCSPGNGRRTLPDGTELTYLNKESELGVERHIEYTPRGSDVYKHPARNCIVAYTRMLGIGTDTDDKRIILRFFAGTSTRPIIKPIRAMCRNYTVDPYYLASIDNTEDTGKMLSSVG